MHRVRQIEPGFCEKFTQTKVEITLEPNSNAKPRVPRELKRFLAAMLGIILFIAVASVIVAMLVEQ
jgi:hypothetical protein